jgi:hypothetical protein
MDQEKKYIILINIMKFANKTLERDAPDVAPLSYPFSATASPRSVTGMVTN